MNNTIHMNQTQKNRPMKYLLTFLLVANFTIAEWCQGQSFSWFPENAEWYYRTQCFSSAECGYLHYYTAGDTTLAGYAATIVKSHYQNEDFQGPQSESHFFRVENDTVFYYSVSNQMWGMLYDFNAQPGDVWDLTEILADFTTAWYGEVQTVRVVVDTVTNELIAGEMRRLIHTSPFYDGENIELTSEWEFMGPIVEGIGPIDWSHGLLGESTAQVLVEFPAMFSCYRENGELIHGSGGFPCGVYSSVEEEVAPIGIFPNPTTSHIRLQLPTEFAFRADIRIYNSVGQVVAQIENFNTHDPLPMNYPPGLYIVEARNTNKVARDKVVVEP
jgi:hypothetical protein